MRAPLRLAAGLAVLGALAWGVVPAGLGQVAAHRVDRLPPPEPARLRAQIALLPADVRAGPDALEILARLDRDAALADAETVWNLRVAGALTGAEHLAAEKLVDLDRPTPQPPDEAPTADGDVVALVAALLARYGYAPVEMTELPPQDSWPGADRRVRARGVLALVQGPGLEPAAAHAVLVASITFLDAQVERAHNMERIATLAPAVMGEPKSSAATSVYR